jgi:hypothetical protein
MVLEYHGSNAVPHLMAKKLEGEKERDQGLTIPFNLCPLNDH